MGQRAREEEKQTAASPLRGWQLPTSFILSLRPASILVASHRPERFPSHHGDSHISGGSESGRKWEREPTQAACEPIHQVKYQMRESRDAAGEPKESSRLLFCSHSLKTSQWTQTTTFQALNHGMKSQTAENNPKSQTWSEAEEPCQRVSHL